jgi:hypothetical protein
VARALRRLLIGVAGLGAALVPVVTLRYGFDTPTRLAGAAGFSVMLVVTCALWIHSRRATSRAHDPAVHGAIATGVVLGLFWVVEIVINNFAAPPLPARDNIDNSFFAIIAVAILAGALGRAYQAASIRCGIEWGIWTGFVSGLFACSAALLLIVGGMRFITADPLNATEWAARHPLSKAPTMAAYLAFETLAGAFLHLIVLGLMLGALLGTIGGLLGRGLRRLQRFSSAGRITR